MLKESKTAEFRFEIYQRVTLITKIDDIFAVYGCFTASCIGSGSKWNSNRSIVVLIVMVIVSLAFEGGRSIGQKEVKFIVIALHFQGQIVNNAIA